MAGFDFGSVESEAPALPSAPQPLPIPGLFYFVLFFSIQFTVNKNC